MGLQGWHWTECRESQRADHNQRNSPSLSLGASHPKGKYKTAPAFRIKRLVNKRRVLLGLFRFAAAMSPSPEGTNYGIVGLAQFEPRCTRLTINSRFSNSPVHNCVWMGLANHLLAQSCESRAHTRTHRRLASTDFRGVDLPSLLSEEPYSAKRALGCNAVGANRRRT